MSSGILDSVRHGAMRGVAGRFWVGIEGRGINVEPMWRGKPRRLLHLRIAFAWYDLWVGVFIDRRARTLYVCPLPALVISLRFAASSVPNDTP